MLLRGARGKYLDVNLRSEEIFTGVNFLAAGRGRAAMTFVGSFFHELSTVCPLGFNFVGVTSVGDRSPKL